LQNSSTIPDTPQLSTRRKVLLDRTHCLTPYFSPSILHPPL
jgi:hypothetical protein